jgi:hypothetical protein
VVTPLAPAAEPSAPAPSADRETPNEASERREARRARREARRERREARRERREQRAAANAGAAVERGAPKAGAEGVLMLGAKPPCEIHINGRNTGLVTPQREIALPAGRHTVTLINREHRIRTSFPVRVEAGKPVRVVKDLTDRMR